MPARVRITALIREAFGDIAERSAAEIVSQLLATAAEWHNGSTQNDDITFVVLKVK